jgi:hypothetical protein
MENLELFGDIEEVETKAATRRAMNAVRWLCTKGYRPTIGGLKNLKNFELCNIDTNEVEHFDIDSVLAEYDQERKDEARARAAEKRMAQKGGNAWQH